MKTHHDHFFTSTFLLEAEDGIFHIIMDRLEDTVKYVQGIYDSIHQGEEYDTSIIPLGTKTLIGRYSKLSNSKVMDCTCCLKGVFLEKLLEDITGNYAISIGGDLITTIPTEIHIQNSYHFIQNREPIAVFTSGNTERRPNHIIGEPTTFASVTTIVSNPEVDDLAWLDAYTTLRYAGWMKQVYPEIWVNSVGSTTFKTM